MNSRRYGPLLWLLLAFSDTALAHTPIAGIGNFYNGLLHPVLVPAHLLLLIAVGLFFGQQGLKKVESALGVFVAATLCGLIVAGFSIGPEVELLILILAAAIGLLVAAKPRLGLFWSLLVGALAGFSLGIDSAQETLTGKEKLVSLFGSGVAIYLLLLYPMSLAAYFSNKGWQKVGVRIVGSWIAASAFLVLALSL